MSKANNRWAQRTRDTSLVESASLVRNALNQYGCTAIIVEVMLKYLGGYDIRRELICPGRSCQDCPLDLKFERSRKA